MFPLRMRGSSKVRRATFTKYAYSCSNIGIGTLQVDSMGRTFLIRLPSGILKEDCNIVNNTISLTTALIITCVVVGD